ncbi:MAG: NADP-dependent malic enzyme [Candidatus Marinimicrobia bacterium]|nr:NADP-dependent malic enzyme [Candidatus Neomarinimicrobiota bacterium]MBL7022705.1 NADP-dependent malic enzyme [Candidatus Neomarinimicrobiota bacterium]MBL7109166.1 NADP-dependent malic enzyme [Candidatus Neomarinimicrobiota bacterium]
MITKKQALEYHSRGRKGKIEVVPTKPCLTQTDLSLAYTPGVADPCLEIEKDPAKAGIYTARSNLVAVISNGTAVLGLGDIGALAGKPVMEGKGVLFKRFADIDVFDIELDTHDVEEIIKAVKLMEPTFGGINLEDIKAPECFEIEERLIKEMGIPVFHDDQHGTAIISAAALINACEIANKKMKDLTVVVSGAGASAIACATHYLRFGVKRENVILCDSKGVVYKGRTEGMNKYKDRFANDTNLRTLEEAMVGADVFVGLSKAGLVTQEMVKSMGDNPIVFAMANPDPEITYPDAKAARDDIIMATGRSDYPNQVNNVLGFPFIFRGALDVDATAINDEMKIAASQALADLAKEDVPDEVVDAYGVDHLEFGPDYIIPKPFDPRVLTWEATAVAKAAIDSGVAKNKIDIDKYRDELEARLGKSRELMRTIINKARKNPKRIVFPEGESDRIIRASGQIVGEGIATPILLGNEDKIKENAERLKVKLDGVEILNPNESEQHSEYCAKIYEMRQRKGITRRQACNLINRPNFFGPMMVQMGDADGMVSGITQNYADTLRPALQVLDLQDGVEHVAGMYVLAFKDKIKFFADVTVNINPTSEMLAEIAILAAERVKRFGIEPRIALVSPSNFGSVRHALGEKVKKAVELIHQNHPDLVVDGEMHADVAVSTKLLQEHFPFSVLQEEANVLIFPDLTAGNIAYKLLKQLANATAIGPILMGLSKPVHLLQFADSRVEDVVNMTAIATVDAQLQSK